ncbi:MAG: hypothetical protein KDE59_18840 [Anaerolineales bacterium]|nr:hypothetical protein [Anaerolineales bacterium]MCB0009828.1 hypothetical protein [Anaerolineales bacterium]
MYRQRHFGLLLILICVLCFVEPAQAHRPAGANESGITTIPDPTTSYAYYEALEEAGLVDVYEVTGEAGQFFHAGINIPQIEGLESYGVTLALLGPGLPQLDGSSLPIVPHEHPEDLGTHLHDEDGSAWREELALDNLHGIVAANEAGEDFFEPFTQTNYWGRQELELELPAAGTYYLLVWQPRGMAGKYVMDTGRAEVFGLGDLFRFPVWWVQTHLYFEHTGQLGLGAAILLLLLALIVPRRRRASRLRESLA